MRAHVSAGVRIARRLDRSEQQAVLRSTDMWRLALVKGLEWHASTGAAGTAASEKERAVAALEQALLGHLDDSLAAASLLPDSAAATKRAQVPASCRPCHFG